jgi:ABC-type sugar transport system ATPase subunit
MEHGPSFVDAAKPILEVRGVSKSFGGVQALKNVDLTLYDRELLALLGDNGAGKSTLCKVISGVYACDKGSVSVDGKAIKNGSIQDAKRLGIKMIYQDLALFDELDVTSNLFMGEQIHRWGFLRKKEMKRKSREIIERLHTTVQVLDREVRFLSGGQQHSIAVGRGVYVGRQPRILIMDEPTAGLGVEESNKMLELLMNIRREVSVILITHHLDFVFEVADRAVILRSGQVAGEVSVAQTSKNEIIGLMVGAT